MGGADEPHYVCAFYDYQCTSACSAGWNGGRREGGRKTGDSKACSIVRPVLIGAHFRPTSILDDFLIQHVEVVIEVKVVDQLENSRHHRTVIDNTILIF